MNKTLFVLTLVTAVTTPIIICTGIYGMNFVDMPELVQPSPPLLDGHLLVSSFVQRWCLGFQCLMPATVGSLAACAAVPSKKSSCCKQ